MFIFTKSSLMRTYLYPVAVLAVLFTLTFSACQKDPHDHNDEEVITSLVYTLTPISGMGTSVVTFTFSDEDGDGGDAPVITNGVLTQNTLYSGVITLFNESVKPSEAVHTEIEAEDEEHQFFFEDNLSQMTIMYKDQDGDGNPLGLKTEVETMGAEQGELTIILKHEPNKSATGISIGNSGVAGGETDIEVKFNVSVQ
jgi:hypothetical protein